MKETFQKDIADFYQILKEIEEKHKNFPNSSEFIKFKESIINLCKENESYSRELQKKNAFLEKLIGKLNVAIFTMNVIDGKFVFDFLNPTHEQLTGYTTEEVKGKTPHEFLPEDIAIQVESNYQKCLETKSIIEYEEKLILKGKETYWLTRLIPLIDDNEKVYYIIGTSINITEYKKLTENLQLELLELKKVFDISPTPIFIKDKKLNFIDCNKAFEEFFGIPRDLLMKIKNYELFDENLGKTLSEKEQWLLANPGKIEFQVSFNKDEKEKTIKCTLSSIEEDNTIVGLAGYVEDITSLIEYQRFLENLAIKDELTGLYNRRGLSDFVNREWRNAIRYRQPISVLMIDIDNFKAYNDTYGHKAGDECLRKVSEILTKNAMRPADIISRIGGEEFLVVLPNTPFEGGMTVANRMREAIFDAQIEHKASPFGVLTISIGVSTTIPGRFEKFELLLEDADKNMYIAKKKGKNRVEGYKYLLNS